MQPTRYLAGWRFVGDSRHDFLVHKLLVSLDPFRVLGHVEARQSKNAKEKKVADYEQKATIHTSSRRPAEPEGGSGKAGR